MSFRQDNFRNVQFSRSRGIDISAFMSRVYGWMMIGIIVTGIVAYAIGNNPEMVKQIFAN